jgi:hypothetical protein
MKRLAPALPLFFFLAGCASEPPPPAPTYKEQLAAATPITRDVPPPPAGRAAPVDQWRERLAQLLPSPWHLEAIEAQVVAPPGWTRMRGDRGLLITFEDGLSRQSFWLLPRDFEGKIYEPRIAAEPRARSDQYILYGPRKDALGWDSTQEVASALELR